MSVVRIAKHLINVPVAAPIFRIKGGRFNFLLKFLIAAFFLINLIQLSHWLNGTKSLVFPVTHSLIILVVLLALLWLSSQKHLKTAAWLLFSLLTITTFHLIIWQNTNSDIIFLLAVLIVILSGLLINNRYILISSGAISLLIITLSYWQHFNRQLSSGISNNTLQTLNDATIYTVLMLTIAWTAWIFAYDLRQSLHRIRLREKKLRQDYISLEEQILKRTEQWLQSEKEKISQLYRLAEFGRLSSGIFHDLINPLTAVSLNLEQLSNEGGHNLIDTQSYLEQALQATSRMKKMVAGVKSQIQPKRNNDLFSVDDEIEQIIQVLSFKARRAGVKIHCQSSCDTHLYGNTGQFSQIMLNLLANAIEASEDKRTKQEMDQEKDVNIRIKSLDKEIIIEVEDKGVGIKQNHLEKIFQPFFSTKLNDGRGLGLGLSSAKDITEKHFGGKISVTSRENQGSCFRISLPFNHNST